LIENKASPLEAMVGYIYFLSNPAMPGLLKIGFTARDLFERLSELRTTSVPLPFVLEAAFHVNRPTECERLIHKALEQYRHTGDREFFQIGLRDALEQVWGHIQAAMVVTESDDDFDSDPHPFPELKLEEEELLWALMDKPRYLAVDWSWFRNQLNCSDEEAKLLLLDLAEKRFLKERKNRNQRYESTWELGHKGLKYAVWLNKSRSGQ
jgi:hypothetical protein